MKPFTAFATQGSLRRPVEPSRFRCCPDTLVGVACVLILPIAALLL